MEPTKIGGAEIPAISAVFPALNESFNPRITDEDGDEKVDGVSAEDHSDSSSDSGNHIPNDNPDDVLSAPNPPSRKEKLRIIGSKAKHVLKHGSTGHEKNKNKDQSKSSVLRTLKHPHKAVGKKVTGTVANGFSGLNQPVIARDTDAALVDAHEKRDDAEAENDGTKANEADGSIKELQMERRNMRLAWILSEEVHEARAVQAPKRERPQLKNFQVRDESGNPVMENGNKKIDWLSYAGQVRSYISHLPHKPNQN
jgi:hypothetical protein